MRNYTSFVVLNSFGKIEKEIAATSPIPTITKGNEIIHPDLEGKHIVTGSGYKSIFVAPINLKEAPAIICEIEGHIWSFYIVSSNIWNDIEQAGFCTRCHYDTHSQSNKEKE